MSQNEPTIERFYLKDPKKGIWLYQQITGLESSIRLQSIGCTIRLKDIYSNLSPIEDWLHPSVSPLPEKQFIDNRLLHHAQNKDKSILWSDLKLQLENQWLKLFAFLNWLLIIQQKFILTTIFCFYSFVKVSINFKSVGKAFFHYWKPQNLKKNRTFAPLNQ